jgi:hypothetical protein
MHSVLVSLKLNRMAVFCLKKIEQYQDSEGKELEGEWL